jgi:hypothetical protein
MFQSKINTDGTCCHTPATTITRNFDILSHYFQGHWTPISTMRRLSSLEGHSIRSGNDAHPYRPSPRCRSSTSPMARTPSEIECCSAQHGTLDCACNRGGHPDSDSMHLHCLSFYLGHHMHRSLSFFLSSFSFLLFPSFPPGKFPCTGNLGIFAWDSFRLWRDSCNFLGGLRWNGLGAS